MAGDTATGSGRVTLLGETPITSDLMDYFRLEGKVGLVTGASSGIGKRLARVLHAAGAEVMVTARREERLKELCDELGSRAHYMACDLLDPASMENLIDETIRRCGRLDVLVNNAGFLDTTPTESKPLEEFRLAIDTNLVATFYLSRLAAEKAMLPQGSGSIINIGSILGLVSGSPFTCAGYCSSKGGIANLTRDLAVEWAQRGIRVNAIAPGYFPTEMTEASFNNPDAVAFISSSTPVGRGGDQHELDAATLFLAGPGNSYVTGQVLYVDGGYTCK